MIASFKLYFHALDSFQALFIMDAINNDHYLGKLPIVTSQTANLTSPTGKLEKILLNFLKESESNDARIFS